jgi:cysteine synthase A
MALQMTQTEGMMIGPSSGAVMKVALEIAARPEAAGKTIVALLARCVFSLSQPPSLC